jgi:threonine aldolase
MHASGTPDTSSSASTLDDAEKRRLKGSCRRFLSGHRPRTMRERLHRLAELAPDELPDAYGVGSVLDALERRVAELLGKEKAVFVPKGVIAQQAALRVWSERANRPALVIHPKSHIDLDEEGAYERLHPFRPIRRGADHAPLALKDLEDVREPIFALTVELPLRRVAFRLPTWDELTGLAAWAGARGAAFHLDGARLWEAQPFYGRSLAEIAGLASSVYVSFYKGLGGLAGCALAGSADFIAETAVWRTRHGANMHQAYPYALAALEGLDRHLPRMAAYAARACEIALALIGVDGITPIPLPPHTNAFQVHLRGEPPAIEAKALTVAAERWVWLFNHLTASAIPGRAVGEIQIGDAADHPSTDEIVALLLHLLA